MRSAAIIFLINFLWLLASAQSAASYAVLLQAEVQKQPPLIRLNWHYPGGAPQYLIYRKQVEETVWGTPYDTVFATNSFADSNVTVGTAYEYYVKTVSNPTGHGYIMSGIEVVPGFWKGKLALVVDTTHAALLESRLRRLQIDLRAEGWQVERLDVDPQDDVTAVKNRIQQIYYQDTAQLKAVLLFGHVPVPYSGNIAPDAHADHQGAWPADGYYADMDGNWTDVSVANSSAAQARNRNVPGDGKFDQSIFPSALELVVGRVDLYNMSSFAKSEADLLAAYLDNDHNFRTALSVPRYRAIVDDNFGVFSGEAFAANGWRNFPVTVSRDSIEGIDYRAGMRAGSYLWAYGCGGGSYTSVSGVVSTSDFVVDSMLSTFNMLFGSYFGDWDSPNNLLRAALSSGTGLAAIWAGRPHYAMHFMGMGTSIGESVLQNMNNTGTYYSGGYVRWVHMGMMGDPTLRMFNMQPPTSIDIAAQPHEVSLSWHASADAGLGYLVYRRQLGVADFELQTPIPLQQTSFTDSCLTDGTYEYFVQAVKWQQTFSGSFFNYSPGLYDTITVVPYQAIAQFDTVVNTDTVLFTNQSIDGVAYQWHFGDMQSDTATNPLHVYRVQGTYTVWLLATDVCGHTDSISKTITIAIPADSIPVDSIVGLLEYPASEALKLFPNPNNGVFELTVPLDLIMTGGELAVYNLLGEKILTMPADSPYLKVELPPGTAKAGLYILHLHAAAGSYSIKFLVESR